jgi:hypothetical protein
MELDDLIYEEHGDFNQYLDDTENEVVIAGVNIRASEVLFTMQKETYRIALTDYNQQQIEEFKDAVYSSFPTPIAYYFRQVHYGYLDHNNRLHLLRSTWEACIFILYAIIVGEARKKNFPLRIAGVRENDLYNFSLDRKINIIEKILIYNRDNSFGLTCGNLFEIAEILQIKELNYQRNGFQHIGALSEEQASNKFIELLPEVLDTLKNISNLKEYEIFHFINSDGNPLALRCETFIGQSPNRTFKTYPISAAQLVSIGTELTNQQVLVKINDELYAITPFIHFMPDDDGHLTNLCYLHQYNPDNPAEFKFEIARRATYAMMPVNNFNDRILELRVLST